MSNSLPKKQAQSSFDTRTCPYCLEQVKINATVCSHCGRDISTARQKLKRFLRLYIQNLIVVTVGVIAIYIIGRMSLGTAFTEALAFFGLFLSPAGKVLGILLLAAFALPRR